jgi:protein involved in polysaccharide export with SLBB domain
MHIISHTIVSGDPAGPRRGLSCLAGVAILSLLAGCTAPRSATPAGAVRKPDPGAPPPVGEARLRAGLVVNVAVWVGGRKEIEEAGKRISDNGALTLPLLGTLQVEEAPLDTLGVRLSNAYKDYFVNPQVIVEFVRDDNREGLSPWGYVTVLGRVKKPGRVSIPATRDITLSGAIQQAGGYDTSAKDTAIRVTRRDANGQARTREIDLRAVGSEGKVAQDIVLQAEDVVFVPELVF